jgi:hypothetical protein
LTGRIFSVDGLESRVYTPPIDAPPTSSVPALLRSSGMIGLSGLM